MWTSEGLSEEVPQCAEGPTVRRGPPQARVASETCGLPCRRHFPWNLILLAIFVSDWGELGGRR